MTCASCYVDERRLQFPINREACNDPVKFKRKKGDPIRWLAARDGDWLLAPFQCDVCWFINLFGRKPNRNLLSDVNELAYIRRVNLDVFWSRERSTVRGLFGKMREVIRRSQSKGRPVALPEVLPWPVGDKMGMSTAILMLEKSMDPGVNDTSYIQFDTCRAFRSLFADIYSATVVVTKEERVFKSRKGDILRLHSDPMQSPLMERFTKGMKARMPETKNRNLPLVGSAVAALLERMEEELLRITTSSSRQRQLIMAGGYISVCYGYSLRGNEAFLIDGDRLVSHIRLGKHERPTPHVCVTLMGKFKGESGDKMQVFPLANITKSGVKIRWWLEQVVNILRVENLKNCPAFCDEKGYLLSVDSIEDVMHPVLKELQGTRGLEAILPEGISVEEKYKCYRSFRRGAASTAHNEGVPDSTITLVHRWSRFEASEGKQPGFNMMEHYVAEFALRKKQLSFSTSV